MKPKVYQIYTLTCPIDNVVRYVGCSMNAERRLMQHLSTPSGTEAKIKWLQRLTDKGLKPILSIVEEHILKEKAVSAELRVYNLFDSHTLYCVSPSICKYSPNRRIDAFNQNNRQDSPDLFSVLMDPLIVHSKLAKKIWPEKSNPKVLFNDKLWQRNGQKFTDSDVAKIKVVLGEFAKRLEEYTEGVRRRRQRQPAVHGS